MTFNSRWSGRGLRPTGHGQSTITPTASELQDCQSTAPSARPTEFKESVVAKTNDKRQAVRSHFLRQEIEDRVSFVFIEEYMFILAESTGILLDPRCRLAFQNGGSTLQVGTIALDLSNGCGSSDARSGIGECAVTHISGKIVENPNVIWRRLEWSHWERSRCG